MNRLRCRGRSWWMDPDLGWERLGPREPLHEAFRVFEPRLPDSALARGEHLTGPVVMDISRSEHCALAVAMLVVVPREASVGRSRSLC